MGTAQSRLQLLKCDEWHIAAGATDLDVSNKRLGAADATLLAGVLAKNASVSDLK